MAPFRAMLARAQKSGGIRLLAGGAAALLAAGLASSCTTESLMSMRPDVDVGMQTAAVLPAAMPPVEMPPQSALPPADLAPTELPPAEAPTPAPTTTGLQTLVPSNPYMVAYPRPDAPAAPPSMSMPAEEMDCRNELKRLGVTFRDLAPINDGGACRIDHPVKISAIGSVGMKPAATLSCRMAATFARWTRKELVPAARWKYFSGVKTIHQGSSYFCRRIARSRTPSQHSVGNALDVMRIELNNGRDIDVRKPGWFSFRQRGFLNTVRADGCSYFTTVLGPGYNYDHRNHFHFDIMPRRNGRVACR